MSRFLRSSALAALTVAASCAIAGAAGAQTYDRLVVFGDSLSDNGNLYAATGGTTPVSPPYYQGRFSTGPVFTELLGFNLARVGGNVNGSIDFAYGGARTDDLVIPGAPPGMQTQLQMYLGMGGTFDSNDLVSVLGGANNIFPARPSAGAAANPLAASAPVANGAAANINSLVNSVAGAGAGTILVTNLPKLSLTPQFRGTAAAPLADYAVSTFNTALANNLAATAAARPGTNIIMMDLFKIGDTIANNPTAFGVSNVTAACITPTSVCSNPGDYFYADPVHPTAAGHRALASLANDYLYYADRGAGSALLGETAIRHREDGLDAATEALSGRAPWHSGTALTFAGSVDRTETDARGVVSEARSDGWGLRLGLETGPSDTLRFGVAGGFRSADVEAGALSFSVESWSGDVYAGWRSDSAFITAAAGLAADGYDDIERLTGVGPVVHTGSTEGTSAGARLQGGLWFDLGGLAVSPRAAVTWASSDVDTWFETGVAAQYEYGDREIAGVSGEVALRAEGDLGGLAFFVEGGYRDSLSDSFDPVTVGIRSNTAQVLEREVEEPFGGQILASAGLEGEVGPFKVTAAYRGRFGDHADSHMGGLTLVLPLQ